VPARLGAEEQVFLYCELRHQRELLEHGADAQSTRAMHGCQLDRHAAHEDFSGSGRLCPRQQRNERGFARAVFSEQDVHLAGTQLEIDVIEREHTGVLLDDPTARDERRDRPCG
jgi:hypothetical protein